MKKILFLILGAALLLLPMTGCESLEPVPDNDVGKFMTWADGLIDKTRHNKHVKLSFCDKWEFEATQVERWVDGKLVETKDVDNIFPYRTLLFKSSGYMEAEGMGGQWEYRYNYLFIDVSKTGGSNYFYEVEKLNTSQMVLREEDYAIGGPIVTFAQDPSGTHYFYRFFYKRK